MMHSKMPIEPAKSAAPSTKGRVLTVAEHRMKRMHEEKSRRVAEEIVAHLNKTVKEGR